MLSPGHSLSASSICFRQNASPFYIPAWELYISKVYNEKPTFQRSRCISSQNSLLPVPFFSKALPIKLLESPVPSLQDQIPPQTDVIRWTYNTLHWRQYNIYAYFIKNIIEYIQFYTPFKTQLLLIMGLKPYIPNNTFLFPLNMLIRKQTA